MHQHNVIEFKEKVDGIQTHEDGSFKTKQKKKKLLGKATTALLCLGVERAKFKEQRARRKPNKRGDQRLISFLKLALFVPQINSG